MRIRRKFLCFFVFSIIGVLFITNSFSASATESNYSKEVEEVRVDDEVYQFEKVITEDSVIVTVIDSKGEKLYTAVNKNDVITLNGEVVQTQFEQPNEKLSSYKHINNFETFSLENSRASSTIKWGPWSHVNRIINTGSDSTVVICTIISAASPWVPLNVVSGLAGLIAGKYAKVQMIVSTRYGTDSRYEYYQRETKFYGVSNGVMKKIGQFDESRKKLL